MLPSALLARVVRTDRSMVTSTRRVKQEADLKHVVGNVLDSYLTSISIQSDRKLDSMLNITILPEEFDRTTAFQQYIRYISSQLDLSLGIQDCGTIPYESFND